MIIYVGSILSLSFFFFLHCLSPVRIPDLYEIDSALVRETARLEREFPMQRIEAGQFEDLFEKYLHQYDSERDMVAFEQKTQDQIEEQIREANRAFVNARKGAGDSSTKEREKALQDLENGYLKYKEIISNIDVGRKFYNDLAKLVGRFRDDCKNFVSQRRVEAAQLEKYVKPFSFLLSFFVLLVSNYYLWPCTATS